MTGWRQVYDRQPPMPQYQVKGFAEELLNTWQTQPAIRILAAARHNPASPGVNQKIAFIIWPTMAQCGHRPLDSH
jgi:hypothetical protein